MSLPIAIKELQNYLPHRPPMVWVDQVIEVGDDYKKLSGACSIRLDKQALFVNNQTQLRASSAIEFSAQAFGYIKAAYQVMNGLNNPPTETYLTGVRHCEADFSSLDLETIDELHVHVGVTRELSPLTFVRGEVRVPGQTEPLATTEIQVYFD